MTRPDVSVLIPAFNEASVIHRALFPLAKAATEGQIEVIVIANGCTDDTCEVAKRICPAARVITIDKASKIIALNAGARYRNGRSVVCLDADISISDAQLRLLVRPLLLGRAELSFGQMHPDLTRSSLLVRSFYRGWQLNPYFDNGKVGGVIALSNALADDIFPLPPFISDDEYISRFAAKYRKLHVPEASFRVVAPATIKNLVAIRRRSRRGTAALEREGFKTERSTNSAGYFQTLARALKQPARLPDVFVYGTVSLWARLTLLMESRHRQATWERDLSSRNI